MIKVILTTAVFCLLYTSSLAQSYDISGELKNTDGVGVPYASIALSEKSDTSTVLFAIAKEDGTYSLKNVEAGDYYLVVACIGFDVVFDPKCHCRYG